VLHVLGQLARVRLCHVHVEHRCGRVGFGSTPEAGGDGSVDAGPRANRVFTTSSRIAGDFGGPAAADAICQMRAAEQGLAGTFVAFVCR